MEDLLNQLNLSPNAIAIYLKVLGRTPLTSFELYSIVPTLAQDEFDNVIGELIEIGLLVPITTQDSSILNQYLAIPPFNPITNYYSNINANLDSIKHQLHQLLTNSLKKIFQENPIIEMSTIHKNSQNLRKDLEEDAIIQKQDLEDTVQGMEGIKIIEDVLENLKKTIIGITQTEFASLIKIIKSMKNDIIEKVELLELKKYESEVKYIINQVFKDQFDKIVGDFTATLLKLIEDEFKNTLESLSNIINSTLQLRNDLKMLLLNMLNNFENDINKLIDIIRKKKENLTNDLEEFEKVIDSNFSAIVSKSIESVAALNNPIDKAMKNYYSAISSNKNLGLFEIVNINSISRVNEEIKNAVLNAQQNLSLVVPKLEDHLSIEDFGEVKSTLKTQIASSEAHTNSIAKKYKDIKSLEYRTLKNESVIILNRDNLYILIGVLQHDSKDTLQDFIGFSTNSKPLLKLFNPVFRSVWEAASSSLHETPKSIGIDVPSSKKDKELKSTRAVKSIAPTTSPTTAKKEVGDAKDAKTLFPEKEVQPTPDKISDLTENIQQQIDFTSQTPLNSKTSVEIDAAFRVLVKKLPNLKGEEFSEELDKVAELILEKKGFSVTLHKIRSKINQYQTQGHLSDVDINHIIENIEEWKKKLL